MIHQTQYIGLCQCGGALFQITEIHQPDIFTGQIFGQQLGFADASLLQNKTGFGAQVTQTPWGGLTALAIEPVGDNQRTADTVAIRILVTKNVDHRQSLTIGYP